MNRRSTQPLQKPTAPGNTHISTGLRVLDGVLGGGFPVGSTVVIVGSPDSSSERVCHQFATTHATPSLERADDDADCEQPVLYIATDAMTRGAVPIADGICHMESFQTGLEALIEHSDGGSSEGTPPVLVVDRFSDLLNRSLPNSARQKSILTGYAGWFDALEAISATIRSAKSVALLHLHVSPDEPLDGPEARIFSMADSVLHYQQGVLNGAPEKLAVSKVRGGPLPPEPFALEVGTELQINPDQQV